VETQFALASGAKALTALAVVSLIEAGVLARDARVREWLGDDLQLIGDDVTVGHLLTHTSGIGDYLDEARDDLPEYAMPISVHRLATTEDYVQVLDGFPPKFAPGERFAYSNGGYVVLALVAERASGVSYYDLVDERVCRRAGMRDTAFLRSDELPAAAALGYVSETRTNVFHLPVRGSGDGGVYSTLADVESLWRALCAGEIVSREWVSELTRPHTERYGLGFWVGGDRTWLTGADHGVSFYSEHRQGRTRTVISNTTDGAWPVARSWRETSRRGSDPGRRGRS
jgi:CubicO group peptidase (beta-lactamase class C family)